MKKLLILLSLLMLCCGCDEKKEDDIQVITENIAETANKEDTAPEKPFMMLKSTGFKTVKVNVSVNDGTPPEYVKYIDIRGLDFGEKIPPCAAAEDHTDSEEATEDMGKPQKGQIQEYVVGDDSVYFFVSYDAECYDGSHSSAFFSYDPESGSLSEIAAFERPDETISISPMTLRYLNDKLYYIGDVPDGENSSHYGVYSIDTKTGKREKAFDDEAFSDRDAPNYPLDTLICQEGHLYAVDYTNGTGQTKDKQVIYGMDNETGEWSEIFSEDDPYKPSRMFDGNIVTINRNDDRKVCVHTDRYDFVSPFRSSDLVYAGDNEIALIQSNRRAEDAIGVVGVYGSSELHIYDFEKKEHYVFYLNELGAGWEIEKVKNGYLVTNPYLITNSDDLTTAVYYLLPELGMAFNVTNSLSNIYDGSGDEELDKLLLGMFARAYNVINVNNDKASVISNEEIVYMEK